VLDGFPTYSYTILRSSETIYQGEIPITQAVDVTFSSGYLEIVATGFSSAVALTVSGSTSEEFTLFPSSDEKVGSSQFTDITSIISNVGSTQGFLVVSLVDSGGGPIQFNQVVETGKGVFQYSSLPQVTKNFGENLEFDAVLIKRKGVHAFEGDIVGVAGDTFTVVKASELVDAVNEIFFNLALRKVGREPLVAI